MKLLRLLSIVLPAIALVTGVSSEGATATDVYTEEGLHQVNGREWRTACTRYSSNVDRCRTEILATQVEQVGGRFVQSTDWVFNNLTYKPSPRSVWEDNPLGGYGEPGAAFGWTATDGRGWRVECDTAATGNGACRAYTRSSVIESRLDRRGNRTFHWVNKWVFNNIVRFTPTAPTPTRTARTTPSATKTLLPPTTPTTPVATATVTASATASTTATATATASTTATPTPSVTATATATPEPTESATPGTGLAAPAFEGISGRSDTSISFRFTRSADDLGCSPGLTYQVRVDAGAWHDVGNFDAACDRRTIGYKFEALTPGTEYVLEIRAVREEAGTRTYSESAQTTASTTGTPPTAPASPTPSATPSNTPSPSATASASETSTPTDTTAPRNIGVTNQTDTSISVGFLRPIDSDGVCSPRITYQVRVDAGGWADAGGFDAACERERVGYKFDGLVPGTQYELGVRAVLTIDGTKSFSAAITAMGSTTGETPTATPTPTTSPSATPTATPSPTATPTTSPTHTPPLEPTPEPSATFDPKVLSAPRLRGPVNQTETTISIVIYRVEESFGICQPDIFYEMRGGEFADWHLHGTFPTAPCDDPDPGFKFQNLQPDTAYTFEVRAYRLIGDEKYYSPVSSISGRTPPLES